MMEYLVEALLQDLFAFVFSFFGEGFGSLFGRFAREKSEWNIALNLFSSVVLGVVLGVLSLLIVPMHIIQAVSIPGISLFLAPLLVGGTMYMWGRYRRGKGLPVSMLATFWGGALFAFSSALVRFLFLRLF
jgi:hypothetical protein